MVWRVTGNVCFNVVSFTTGSVMVGYSCLITIKRAFSVSFDAINILTEIALILWPTVVIIRLHASKKRRIVFTAAFGSRVLFVPSDRWCTDLVTDLVQRHHSMYCSSGLHRASSR